MLRRVGDLAAISLLLSDAEAELLRINTTRIVNEVELDKAAQQVFATAQVLQIYTKLAA